ncbi:MAG TPA: hypothetical protein ENN36_04615 [Candidatus Bathyarchaeota archaeon]|nr:hypothetical protein [Candidatus Bathyarchaeota archaeon]
MRRKFVLGLLVPVLVLSMILCGFSNFNGANQDHHEELTYGLDPTLPKSEPANAETAGLEPTLEQKPTEHEQTGSELAESEPTGFESIQSEPKPEPMDPETTQPTPLTQTNYSIPVANAIKFFGQSQEAEAMLWLDVMHRRFGIEEFVNSLQRFDQLVYLHPDRSSVRLFRRIADYDNPVYAEDLKRVKSALDRITLPALYCDRLDFPSDYLLVLEEGVRQGGYHLTHVLLAWIWIQENGCEVDLADGFIEEMYHANAALINTDPIVTDLELEAAAFLCLAGQSELIDDAFLDRVISSQGIDGGWESSERWHTTVLGLLFLMHVEFPSDAYPPVLSPCPA